MRTFPNVLADSGYNIQEFGLARALVKNGYSVDVYLAGDSESLGTKERSVNGDAVFREIRLSIKFKLMNDAFLAGLFENLKREKYDLIQIQGFVQIITFLITRWAVKRSIPVCVNEGEYDYSVYGRLKGLQVKLFHATLGKYVLGNIGAVAGKNEKVLELFQSLGAKRVHYLPVGLDESVFDNWEKSDCRQKLGISPQDKMLLYVGTYEPRRQVPFLVEVLCQIHKAGIKAHLVVIGEGEEMDKCREIARKENLGDFLHLLGRLEQRELPAYYDASDLFVFASQVEILGMVLMESLFFGTPVVCTPTPGALDVMGEGQGKILKDDRDLWVKEIVGSLQNGNTLKEKLDQNPFDRTWTQVAGQYIQFYESLLPGR